jgi:hypothetical protein
MQMKTRQKLMLALAPLCFAAHAAAATITANPGDNLQAKVNAAANGTLNLGAGTFNVSIPLIIHTGTTIVGAPNLASHVVFNVTGTDASLFGMTVDANAQNVTIEGVDLVSNHGLLKLMDGNGYNAIHFIANNAQFGGGAFSNGNLVYGITATVGCNDLEICWNYFHDSQNSVRNWEVWNDKNSHLDHNLFYNVADGGHFEEPTLNNTFSWNYGTLIHRMGQEIQGSGHNESGLICDHDVFYDFVNAYNDTEGMSVCPNYTNGVVVSNGYFRNSLASGATFGTMTGGAVGGPNRFGYALESIAPAAVFQNNTIILSSLSADAIASGETTTANNNTVFGGSNTLWGVWGPDFGPTGTKGSFTLGSGTLANVVNLALNGAPPPPANTFAGPAIYAATNNGTLWTPTWTPPNAPTNTPAQGSALPINTSGNLPGLTVTPTNSTAALSWTTPLANVSIHTFTPTDDCGTITLTDPAVAVTLANLNAGWTYCSAITGTLNGVAATGSITYATTGISPAGTTATTAALASAPTTSAIATTQPASPVLVHTVQVFSDGSINVTP